jgi:hypothetical protein
MFETRCGSQVTSISAPSREVRVVLVLMRNSLKFTTLLLTPLIVAAGGANTAAATPLTPFRYEAQAQRHCPADTVVWLDFRKGIYYAKRQKFYGRGSNGSFACLEEVRSNFYRRSLLGLR